MPERKKLIRQLQTQLEAHQKNLNYAEEQEARYGPLSVPLKLHNQLAREREIVDALQQRLRRLKTLPPASGNTLTRLKALAAANIPTVAAVDNDVHWHGIIAEVATAFGYPTEKYTVGQVLAHTNEFCQAKHTIAVLGLPAPSEFSRTLTINSWTKMVVAVSKTMPTILFTTRESRSVAIATRYALLKHDVASIAILQKETFTYEWFTKMFKKALEAQAN